MKESKLIRRIIEGWGYWWVGQHWIATGCPECFTRLVWGFRA